MAKNTEATKPAPFPWLAVFVGIPLLLAWVAICAAAFLYVLNAIGASESVLQWTTWPVTLIMLGMPLIVGVMLGGLQFMRQLLELKQFSDKLPEFVKDIERMTSAIKEAAASANEAADAADQAAGEAANANSEADPVLVARFFKHYDRVKELFEEKMSKLPNASEFPRYLQKDREGALTALKKARLVSDGFANYVIKTIDLERSTRRTRRTTLTSPEVAELDQLAATLS